VSRGDRTRNDEKPFTYQDGAQRHNQPSYRGAGEWIQPKATRKVRERVRGNGSGGRREERREERREIRTSSEVVSSSRISEDVPEQMMYSPSGES